MATPLPHARLGRGRRPGHACLLAQRRRVHRRSRRAFFEVEIDKGVSEVESALAKVLVKRLLDDGVRASAGDTIAFIRRPGEPEETTSAALSVAAR